MELICKKTKYSLSEKYIIKNGKVKTKSFGMTSSYNLDLFIYVQNGKLCLADMTYVWEFSFSSIKHAEFFKKRKSFPNWHKKEAYNSENYKKFKITTNEFGHYFFKYYKVEITDEKGEFYILIPEYDWENFNNLTHVHIEE